MKNRTLYAIAGVAAAGALIADALRLAGHDRGGLPAVGQVIPARPAAAGPGISGASLIGQHLDLTRWRGRVVAVNFWGAWCVPCRTEAPLPARAARDTAMLGVRFAGIDVRETPPAALAFTRASASPTRASATPAT